MSIRQKLAAAPFAHLLGLSVHAEEDDDARKGKRAEEEDDDKEKDEDKKSKKGKRAEEKDDDEKDDDARRAEDDDRDDDEKDDEDKSKKGKKAKKAEDDDEGMEEDDKDEKKGSASSAVRQDRARIARIVAHGITNGCVRQAASLALDTDMSPKVAIATLNASLADRSDSGKGRLADRMASNPVARVGLDGGASKTAGMSPVAAAIVAAGEKARPSK